MLVLFDNGTPRTLARFLIDQHTVTEARSHGWAELENGELLSKAEAAGFEVLVTTDKNINYQQNLAGRKIAIVRVARLSRSAADFGVREDLLPRAGLRLYCLARLPMQYRNCVVRMKI